MRFSLFRLCIFVVTCISASSCTINSKSQYATFFNEEEFVGFVSSENSRTVLDYELDGVDGKTIHFKSCDEVTQTPETVVVMHQYHLWRLMQINCQASAKAFNAKASIKTPWPEGMNADFVAQLPAAAIPDLGGGTLEGREGVLKEFEPELVVTTINSNSAQAILGGDLDVTYIIMARGDFTGDGNEEVLFRLDWAITSAFGKGFSLLLISKGSEQDKAKIIWRDG